jgi:hypothetical protein
MSRRPWGGPASRYSSGGAAFGATEDPGASADPRRDDVQARPQFSPIEASRNEAAEGKDIVERCDSEPVPFVLDHVCVSPLAGVSGTARSASLRVISNAPPAVAAATRRAIPQLGH